MGFYDVEVEWTFRKTLLQEARSASEAERLVALDLSLGGLREYVDENPPDVSDFHTDATLAADTDEDDDEDVLSDTPGYLVEYWLGDDEVEDVD